MTNNKHSQDRTTRWGHTTTHNYCTTSNNSSSTTPLHTTRPEPKRTHQQLTRAELITPARKTIAQLARTQHPYPNHIPNRYYRHFQRYFDPDAAFQHLFRHTLARLSPQTTPTASPSMAPLSPAQAPTSQAPTGHSIPTNAPFARGLRKAQRFVMAGWLDNDPDARCVPIDWLPTFSPKPATPTPPRNAPRSRGLDSVTLQQRARVARRRRARRAAAAVRGRRAGRHQSVGAVGLAAYGLLRAHAQRLALVRLAAGYAFRSGASAGV
jgi:hypothetical protein